MQSARMLRWLWGLARKPDVWDCLWLFDLLNV